MPEVSGNSAHVHMDEGIDVVGLKDVELVEPKGKLAELLRHVLTIASPKE